MRAKEFIIEYKHRGKDATVWEDEYTGKYTFDIPKRPMNAQELIKRGAIFVVDPHGDDGWEPDAEGFSLVTLHNYYFGDPWCKESNQHLKPEAYPGAIHGLKDPEELKKMSDQKYKQILWSIEKLGIPDEVAFLDKQAVTEFAPGPDRDNNDEVPDPIFVLANRWWNAAEKQPQIESVLNSMGWSIHQVESEDDAVQLQHRDGTSYFISADDFDPDVFENFAEGIRAYHGNQGGIDTEQLHAPMWFTASRPDAEYYAGDDGYVVVVDLDIQNPYVLQSGEEANSVLRRWQELQAQGYDGIYDRRLGDWIPFSRKQIRVISKDDTFMGENFADGKVKGKSRPGRVKRAGASCSGSVTDLRKRAKAASGEKAKMYHWCANMKSGRKKNK